MAAPAPQRDALAEKLETKRLTGFRTRHDAGYMIAGTEGGIKASAQIGRDGVTALELHAVGVLMTRAGKRMLIPFAGITSIDLDE